MSSHNEDEGCKEDRNLSAVRLQRGEQSIMATLSKTVRAEFAIDMTPDISASILAKAAIRGDGTSNDKIKTRTVVRMHTL